MFPVHLEKFPHSHMHTYIFYHCLIWFIFHYYYYLRVLKSSLYLSSRPLVSIRVAANTHVHALVEFNDLWYLTICSTIVISFYLEYMNASPPSILFFQRFIVIWCALCHMYMYMCIYKGFLLSSTSSSSSFYMIEHEWRSYKHGMSYNYILLIELLFEKKSN